jgi:hypothetical protein
MLISKSPAGVVPSILRPPTFKPMTLRVPAISTDVSWPVTCGVFRVGMVPASFNESPELSHSDRCASHPQRRRTGDSHQVESDHAVEVKR